MKQLLALLLTISWLTTSAQQYKTKTDISYYADSANTGDAYIAERCKLDLYYPADKKGYATIVWFHGGGITGGNKEIPEQLKNKGYAVAGVGYRLSPKAKAPAYIEDAAAAVAWVFKHIQEYGGSDKLIFISGHSAGGYLGMMVTLDKQYLQRYTIDANKIAGLIPFSGQAITHFTIRQERGIKATQPIIDTFAPLYHVRADAPPVLLITGDREMELYGRYEENAYLARMMKLAGHKETTLYEMDGYDHGGMAVPAFPLLLQKVAAISKQVQ
ncbi:alpha/beta hydrolase fold domain-containing protein [Panacibacter sp. DH6]|uniref:Alpha/beta hydrolase fold domain-containing protein n=1 Tax=Panacibacter microcysteis TaxID=2793269 RepID=A0A931GZ20_9BACT|nr:alpha/beta hydrolase [Panacibacter microcysteis]MBG9377987.1 alpha/beta hydrolase fold domain-containing protein [Panacibacter microcysteis]